MKEKNGPLVSRQLNWGIHRGGSPGTHRSGSHIVGLEQSQFELCYSVGLETLKLKQSRVKASLFGNLGFGSLDPSKP